MKRKKCAYCGKKFSPNSGFQKYCKRCAPIVRQIKVKVNMRKYLNKKFGVPLTQQYFPKELKSLRYWARQDGTTAELNARGRKVKGYRGKRKLTEEEKEDRAWYVKHFGPISKIGEEDWTQPKGMPDEEYEHLKKGKFYGAFKTQREHYKKKAREAKNEKKNSKERLENSY